MSATADSPSGRERRAALSARARAAKRLAAGLAVAGFGAFAGLAAVHSRSASAGSPAPASPAVQQSAPQSSDDDFFDGSGGYSLGGGTPAQPPVAQTRAS